MDPWDPTDDGTRWPGRTRAWALTSASCQLAAGVVLGVVTHGLAILEERDPLICFFLWYLWSPQWIFAVAGAEVVAAAIGAAALGYGLQSAVRPARVLAWVFVIQSAVSGVALLIPPSVFNGVLVAGQLVLTVWAIGILRTLRRTSSGEPVSTTDRPSH